MQRFSSEKEEQTRNELGMKRQSSHFKDSGLAEAVYSFAQEHREIIIADKPGPPSDYKEVGTIAMTMVLWDEIVRLKKRIADLEGRLS